MDKPCISYNSTLLSSVSDCGVDAVKEIDETGKLQYYKPGIIERVALWWRWKVRR